MKLVNWKIIQLENDIILYEKHVLGLYHIRSQLKSHAVLFFFSFF